MAVIRILRYRGSPCKPRTRRHSHIRDSYPNMSVVLSFSLSMDPLSITAGTLAVIQAVSIIVQFIGAVKDASNNLKDLVEELDALQRILHQVVKSYSDDDDEKSATLSRKNTASSLEACWQQLGRLEKNPYTSWPSRWNS